METLASRHEPDGVFLTKRAVDFRLWREYLCSLVASLTVAQHQFATVFERLPRHVLATSLFVIVDSSIKLNFNIILYFDFEGKMKFAVGGSIWDAYWVI